MVISKLALGKRPLKNVPSGSNILRGKWIFDDKRGENGKIIKFKARFVAMDAHKNMVLIMRKLLLEWLLQNHFELF